MVSLALHGQEVRRALPVQSVAADDLAKFLAGVALGPGSPLAPWQESSIYSTHVAALARLTRNYDRNYFSRMRAWSATELAPRIPGNLPVYYFFGGPDAVSVIALFPDAPVYILGGLESVGSIPAPNTLAPEALAEGLDHLRRSAESILSFGHFITKDMKAELDRTAFRGVLPLIYMFISLAGGEVISTRYVGVGSDGTLREYGEPFSGSRGVLPGVQINFAEPAPQVSKPCTMQANLADDSLKSNASVLKWRATLAEATSISRRPLTSFTNLISLAFALSFSAKPPPFCRTIRESRGASSAPPIGAAGSLAAIREHSISLPNIIRAILRPPLSRRVWP